MTAPTLMIMAGGTGGHIMPGLAVAEMMRADGWRVVWLGHPERMEGQLVPRNGIELLPLRFAGLRGKGLVALLKLPFLLVRACCQALGHLRRERPDVVLGMGGYVAVPGGLMAIVSRTPLVVHEQNAVAGSANRLLARGARAVAAGFPAVLGPRTQFAGNPVRDSVLALAAPAQRYAGRQGPLRLLVVGGSLGAHALNVAVPEALALMPADSRPQVVHQAGAQHIEALQQRYAQLGVEADCRAFIEDMAAAYAEADLVVCRAGAMTVAEVAAAGVAALFVPLPHAIDDHQTVNARYLSDAQAGWQVAQKELTPQWLATWLAARTRTELQSVAERARERARPDATAAIANICRQAGGMQA